MKRLSGWLIAAAAVFGGAAGIEAAADVKTAAVPLDKKDGGAVLKVRIQPEARCTWGDLDAIMLDLRERQRGGESTPPRLMLTLETLDSRNPQVLGAALIAGGTEGAGSGEAALVIKPLSSPAVAGLYLCTSGTGDDRCGDKEALRFDAVMNRYRVIPESRGGRYYRAAGEAAKSPVPNRTYFFRPLLVENGTAVFPEQAMSEPRYAELEQAWGAKTGDPSAFKRSFARMRYLSEVLASVPLQAAEKSVLAVLPFYSAVKCGAGR